MSSAAAGMAPAADQPQGLGPVHGKFKLHFSITAGVSPGTDRVEQGSAAVEWLASRQREHKS